MFDPKQEEMKPWEPLSLQETSQLLQNFDGPWWVGGGYAIEDYVGETYREHSDVDVVIRREDLEKLKEVLNDWQLCPSDPPGTLRVWEDGEVLPNRVRDIWGRKDGDSPWCIQFMVNNSEGESFLYKRDESISFPIQEFTRENDEGIRFLSPELQLLYKAKGIRAKDEMDFKKCLPFLSEEKRLWLKKYLKRCYGDGHPWIAEIEVYED